MKLITGGAGFLGRELARQIATFDEDVRILDMRDTDIQGPNVEYMKGDITDLNTVLDACRGVDGIYNLASLLPVSRAGNMFWNVNVGGTRNVLEAARESGIKNIVHTSTSIVYGVPERIPCDEGCKLNPVGDYGKAKVEAEKICGDYSKKYEMKIAIIRPRFTIGPGRMGLLTILFEWIKRGKRIYLIGSGKNRFQMVAVSDLANACILAMEREAEGPFNIGADNVPRVYDIIEGLIKHAGSKSKITPTNAFLTRNVLMVLDKLKLTPLSAEHYRIADKEYVLETTKAKTVLGWKPRYSHQEAFNATYDWYIENYGKVSKGLIPSDVPEEGLLKLIKSFS